MPSLLWNWYLLETNAVLALELVPVGNNAVLALELIPVGNNAVLALELVPVGNKCQYITPTPNVLMSDNIHTYIDPPSSPSPRAVGRLVLPLSVTDWREQVVLMVVVLTAFDQQ